MNLCSGYVYFSFLMLINECLLVGSLCLGDFVIVAHTNGVSQVEV